MGTFIDREFKLKCRTKDCNFEMTVQDEIESIERAGEHITSPTSEDSYDMPNINHEVEITRIRVVKYDFRR